MRDLVIKRTFEERLIAIMRGMEEDKILPLAEALYNGGFRMIEVTFNLKDPDNYSATGRAISALARRFGEDMLAGAGTVVNPELVDIACDAGALYIVSPNINIDVIKRTRELDLVSVPGAFTPSECMIAHEAGADFIKLFPAGEIGPGYLKSIKAPLSHLHFVVTGGINEKNIPDFLKAGAAGFGVGGNIVNKDWIDAGEFGKITDLAKKYVQAAKG